MNRSSARSWYTSLSGRDTACEGKQAYDTAEDAERAAAAHNRWSGRNHDVEPYACPFCGKYHKGRVVSPLVLNLISLVVPDDAAAKEG